MRLQLLTPILIFGPALGQMQDRSDDDHAWAPAGQEDFRGPCPMMNTLANHGYLQRDGRNITRENAVKALADGLNFNPMLSNIMFDQAIIANPEPNATFFTLDQLNVHNLLEHDASLSRTDYYFGNNHVFNETVFNETVRYWPAAIIDANMIANSKVARQLSSKAFNPTYTFTSITEEFSLGEVVAPVIAFGDTDAVTVNKTLVEYFFRNERLPTELGWKKREETVALDTILKATDTIRNATKLITSSGTDASKRRMGRNLHFG